MFGARYFSFFRGNSDSWTGHLKHLCEKSPMVPFTRGKPHRSQTESFMLIFPLTSPMYKVLPQFKKKLYIYIYYCNMHRRRKTSKDKKKNKNYQYVTWGNDLC